MLAKKEKILEKSNTKVFIISDADNYPVNKLIVSSSYAKYQPNRPGLFNVTLTFIAQDEDWAHAILALFKEAKLAPTQDKNVISIKELLSISNLGIAKIAQSLLVMAEHNLIPLNIAEEITYHYPTTYDNNEKNIALNELHTLNDAQERANAGDSTSHYAVEKETYQIKSFNPSIETSGSTLLQSAIIKVTYKHLADFNDKILMAYSSSAISEDNYLELIFIPNEIFAQQLTLLLKQQKLSVRIRDNDTIQIRISLNQEFSQLIESLDSIKTEITSVKQDDRLIIEIIECCNQAYHKHLTYINSGNSKNEQVTSYFCSRVSFFQPNNNASITTLNKTQQSIVDAWLTSSLETITETLNNKEDIIDVLNILIHRKTFSREQIEYFKLLNIWEAILQITSIFVHPCPQNRAIGVDIGIPRFEESSGTVLYYVNKDELMEEPSGLLSLTAYNDKTTLPVTKDAVINYIIVLLKEALAKEEKDLPATKIGFNHT